MRIFTPLRWAVRVILACDLLIAALESSGKSLSRAVDLSKGGDAAFVFAVFSLVALPLILIAQAALRARARKKGDLPASAPVMDTELWIAAVVASLWVSWLLIGGFIASGTVI